MLATLNIDLAAIGANWRQLSERLETAECAAVVKADAYGLGAVPVANCLLDAGCKTLFVATLDEAICLRQQVSANAAIAVLGGLCHGSPQEFTQHQLLPVLYDLRFVELWADYCRQQGQAYPSILKVDTGMHRLGMSIKELEQLLASRVDVLKRCSPCTLMSHLACADEPSNSLNVLQLEQFNQAVMAFSNYFPAAKYSLANSSGIFLGSKYHFDIARPGAALYGVNPTPLEPNPMQAVVRLQLPVMQVKTIDKGDSVGYGGDFVATESTRIAIAFGGYADGLLRHLSSRGYGVCDGVKVPMVGRVSMDSIVYDISQLRSGSLRKEPLYIEVLGDQSVDSLAEGASTIGYEVLTSLGRRYRRQYSGLVGEV